MTTPHKHAALIKQWADGAEIEYFDTRTDQWESIGSPMWDQYVDYRIKPEPKPDYSTTWSWCRRTAAFETVIGSDDVKFTWDGETGVLKSVEIVK